MSVFHSYEKVERLEKEECDGILNGMCYVFEKLDGANAQIYLDTETKEIAYCSRNRVLGIGDNLISGDSFRGFAQWVKDHNQHLKKFFLWYPNHILMGEWLVKHSVTYASECYSDFYVFDVYDSEKQRYESIAHHEVWHVVDMAGIKRIAHDRIIMNPDIEILKEMLKLPSNYGASFREGIVIKNYDFVNKYGRQPYAKLLNEKFKEVKTTKKVVEPDAILQTIVERYVTAARVEKICNKIKDRGIIIYNSVEIERLERLETKHIPQVINMVWYDVISEDMNDILKKFKDPTIDFKSLKRLVFDRAKELFIKSLQEGANA